MKASGFGVTFGFYFLEETPVSLEALSKQARALVHSIPSLREPEASLSMV